VKYGNRNINTTVLGTTPNYPGVHGFEMAAGRMFTLADDSARKRVAVLAAEVPGMLDTDATGIIGRNVSIRSIPFEVIGVLEAKGSTGWRNPDDDVWIPLSTAQFRVTGNEFVERISVLVDQSSSIELAMLDIERVLRREHGILPGKDNDFAMINRKQFAESRQEATQVFTFLLAGIAGVSLVVGGIGIMNIMLVTVTERTREIGIRKALGATRGNILLQFLVESTTLCLLGGALGLLVGATAATLLNRLAGWQTVVTIDSQLDPIDALRHE
jgi:putative ABC transport system permease protein